MRIDYLCAGYIKTFAVLRAFLGSTENDNVRNAFLQDDFNGFPCSSVHGLGQNDCLLVLLCSFFDSVNKSHDS